VLLVAVLGWAIGVGVGGEHFGGPVGLLLSGAALWFLGRKLNDPAKDRILFDPQTGEEVRSARRHTLFWIRMEYWGVLVVIIGVAAFFFPSSSATVASQSTSSCSDDASQKRVVGQLMSATQSLADGHYAKAIRQSTAIEQTTGSCIRSDDNADMYHYVHASAAMIEAQARFALGDTTGFSTFMDATTEAQELADKSDVDPDLQKIAKSLAVGAHVEMKEIQSARKGDLIKPPPSPTP
jgi:hypothetical protein